MPEIVTCACGHKFEAPPDLAERRVNCTSCNAVIFLVAVKAPNSESEEPDTYGLLVPKVDPAEKKSSAGGVEGIPDWLEEYRSSRNVKNSARKKTLAFIERLGGADPVRDPLGAALYLAVTHADAETSVAALAMVGASGHPVYTPVAMEFLEHIGPSDAAGAQQVLALLSEAKGIPAEQVLTRILLTLGPTPLVQVRSLVDLLESKHTALYLWAAQCLKLIGPAAKRAVEPLLKALKIANPALRIAVIDALGTIARDGEHIIPILLQALKHPNPDYRAHAALALGHYGAAAAKAAAPLKEMLLDPHPEVRQAVGEAVRAIGMAIKSAQATASPSASNGHLEPILVVCSCGKRLRAKPELTGKKVKCPGCGITITVPELPAPAAPPPTAPTASPAVPLEEKECPTCLAMMPSLAVLCICCGHNFPVKERVEEESDDD